MSWAASFPVAMWWNSGERFRFPKSQGIVFDGITMSTSQFESGRLCTGPHLRRRMMVEAGLVEGGSRTSSTFFGGGNAVDEFKDVTRWNLLMCDVTQILQRLMV